MTLFATGTKAAAFGGTTTVIDFCNQNRGESPLIGLEDWYRRRANACVDVGAHMILLEVNAQNLADMKTLIGCHQLQAVLGLSRRAHG